MHASLCMCVHGLLVLRLDQTESSRSRTFAMHVGRPLTGLHQTSLKGWEETTRIRASLLRNPWANGVRAQVVFRGGRGRLHAKTGLLFLSSKNDFLPGRVKLEIKVFYLLRPSPRLRIGRGGKEGATGLSGPMKEATTLHLLLRKREGKKIIFCRAHANRQAE